MLEEGKQHQSVRTLKNLTRSRASISMASFMSRDVATTNTMPSSPSRCTRPFMPVRSPATTATRSPWGPRLHDKVGHR